MIDTVTDTLGTFIRVQLYNTQSVNYATERVLAANVTQIVIAATGDSAAASVTGISVPVHTVFTVVSSNQDAVDTGRGRGRFPVLAECAQHSKFGRRR